MTINKPKDENVDIMLADGILPHKTDFFCDLTSNKRLVLLIKADGNQLDYKYKAVL